MTCEICGEQFKLNAALIVHKLNLHKSVERRTKTSEILSSTFQTEDTIYSSDSECEYKVTTRIEVQRIPKLRSSIKEEHGEYVKYEPDVLQLIENYPIDTSNNDNSWDASCNNSNQNSWPIKYESDPTVIGFVDTRQAATKNVEEREFQCVYCKNMYKNKSSVRSHMFYAHKSDDIDQPPRGRAPRKVSKNGGKVGRPSTIKETRTLQCKHCDQIFANRSNYNKHVLTLRDGKPFFCRVCITGFDFRGDLIQHKRQNRDCKSPPREKRYLCTYCGKYFEKKDSLRQHTRVHTKERPYGCTMCPRTFVNKGTLKDHMNSHLGLKPYICPVPDCQKAFRLACTLKQHKMNVHEPPTFKCSFCDKMFSDKKHME